jgi:hypothetical protein
MAAETVEAVVLHWGGRGNVIAAGTFLVGLLERA